MNLESLSIIPLTKKTKQKQKTFIAKAEFFI